MDRPLEILLIDYAENADFAAFCAQHTGWETYVAKSEAESRQILSEHPSVRLVYCETNVGNEFGPVIAARLLTNYSEIFIIPFSDNRKSD